MILRFDVVDADRRVIASTGDASFEAKPWIFLSKAGSAPRNCSCTKSGRQSRISEGTAKGLKLVLGSVPLALRCRKSLTLVPGAP